MHKTYGWALVALLLVFAAGAILAYRHNKAQEAALETSFAQLADYTSTRYGYAFSYPPADTVRAMSDERVLVGLSAGQSFSTYLEARVATSSAADSYEAFVEQELRTLCADAGASCTGPADAQDYTTQTRLTGRTYTFATQWGGKFGPVYVFALQGNVPGATHAALFLYAPSADGALAPEAVARTLRMDTIESR